MAAAAGVTTPLPMSPLPERVLPAGTPGLERLNAARDTVTTAPREEIPAALDRLDREFEAITGRATRAEGDSGGGRTVAQGLFGLRHPDPAGMLRRIAAETGPGVHLSPPRRGWSR